MLFAEWFRGYRSLKNVLLSPCSAPVQFLFCSARNNHINRLYPLFKDTSAEQDLCGWVSDSAVFGKIDETHNSLLKRIDGQWARMLKWKHFSEANKLCRELASAIPGFFSKTDMRKIHVFFVMFLTWKEVWESVLHPDVREVYCTFEKSPVVKAFYAAAKDFGVPKRIHWIHGLRHSSIQSTYATELWCMTKGDVRFFETRVPTYCKPMKKRNPEADMMIEAIGIKRPREYYEDSVHFLFLGPGLESSYSEGMRLEDLNIIKSAQEALGNSVTWRFRPHPSAVKRFQSELEKVGVRIDEFSSYPLNEDLKWADAVGSSWSSLLLDVKETGRPIFWVQSKLRTLGGVDELVEDGVGYHASQESFEHRLTEVFDLEVSV